MGLRLSTWLVLIRSFQVLGFFIPGAMNGWLIYYIHANRLSPSDLMLLLEALVATVILHSFLCIMIMHTRRRSRTTAWMIASVCTDVILCFVNLTIISLLSYSGLPSSCSGFNQSNSSEEYTADLPSHISWTVRLSNEQDGHKVEWENFCSLERGFFFCAVLLILLYILTIITTVFRICELNYTPNSALKLLLKEREEILKLELKLQEQDLPSQYCSPAAVSNPTFVTPISNDEEEAVATYVSISRANVVVPSSNSPISSSSRPLGVLLASIPEAPANRCAHGRALSSPATTTPPAVANRLALSMNTTDFQANMAMISDGSRFSGSNLADTNQLPPYSPGNQRTMTGHGIENNDVRLSDYVKGETRAQDMKDGGNFQ